MLVDYRVAKKVVAGIYKLYDDVVLDAENNYRKELKRKMEIFLVSKDVSRRAPRAVSEVGREKSRLWNF